MSWIEMTDWWLSELATDVAYETVVTPLLLDLLQPRVGSKYLELGSGEGRVMRSVRQRGAVVHGVELNRDLATRAERVVVARLPAIPMRAAAYDGVYAVLILEHISDHVAFFEEAARVTRAEGVMGLVMNHPIWTAPRSTPISDRDGEVLWRPGEYFTNGESELVVSVGTITFYHRPLAEVLNAAAAADWSLEHIVEQPHHEYEDQAGIPRLLGCRWRRH